MKAIVLTCDKYRDITDHMIHTYQKVWPSNPFIFRIPYQEYPNALKEKYGNKVELIKTDKPIKKTIETLFEDIPDDEWIYWCIDDKYLVQIKEKEVNKIYRWISNIKDKEISGIIPCRCRMLLDDSTLITDSVLINKYGQKFIERKYYWQIWIHQFLRAKVVKELFRSFPDRHFVAGEMDKFIEGKILPPGQHLYTSADNLIIFGESTFEGKITRNCKESFIKHKLSPPKNFEVFEKKIIMGKIKNYKLLRYYWGIWMRQLLHFTGKSQSE